MSISVTPGKSHLRVNLKIFMPLYFQSCCIICIAKMHYQIRPLVVIEKPFSQIPMGQITKVKSTEW